ncbi:MAG: hypothetical protein LBT74_07565 [Acidobacteriota bacterium]|nr:hypothetical protein [Acidobacteriota bacterium]
MKGITLNQGNEAHVVDISRGGALIETDVRLRPQMKIVFKVITTQGTFRITGSVLRSSIKSLQGTPIYQSAIVFENPLTMLDDLEPPAATASDADADAAEEAAIDVAADEGAEAEAETVAPAPVAAAAPKLDAPAPAAAMATTDKVEKAVEVRPVEEAELDVAAALTVAMGGNDRAVTEPKQTVASPSRQEAPTSWAPPAPPPVFETPDIFETAAHASTGRSEDEELGPAMKHEDALVFNVLAPDGFGVSFDANDALNDW